TLSIAVLQCSLGLVLLGVMRAPEWRGVWPFAVIALSAGVFSLVNVVYIAPGFSDAAIVAGMRVNFLVAAVHCAAWLTYAFVDTEGRLASLPRVVRVAVAASVAAGLCFALTGWHLVPGEFVNPIVPSGEFRYRLGRITTAGKAFGGWCLIVLAVSLWQFMRRMREQGKPVRGFAFGVAIFFISALDEVLVASEVIRFYSLADIGFLAIIVPVTGDILRRFVEDARRLRELSARLSGEVAERTVERDRAQTALVEAERHAALGRLAAGVGHEINNPLTYLALNLDTLEQWLPAGTPPDDVRDAVASVREASDRIRRVVEGLRTATRASSGELRRLDSMILCESALRVARPQLRHVAHVSTKFGDVPPVLGDEAKLVQVLVNLLTNAAQALGRDGSATDAHIMVRTGTTANGDALIAVFDNGPGIPPDDLARVTEPYFTTRPTTGGTGLGLFLAREMVEQHGGTLAIESTVGRGTTVRIVLPPAAAAEESPAPATGAAPQEANTREHAEAASVILLVDDEPRVLDAFTRALRDEGRVIAVSTGTDAVAAIRQGAMPDVMVCDLMMPGMSGIELWQLLSAMGHPVASRTLFVTGGAVTDDARAFVDREDVRVLFKPVTAKEMREAVRGMLREAVSSATSTG
nr:ATP-binding protein [Gemmatimonadaceae bacterium]